jgi:hypothetical protein
MSIERVILSNLLYNEEFARKIIPFLKDEYFYDNGERVIFSLIDSYSKKYNSFPSMEALYIDLSNVEGLSQHVFDSSKEVISDLKREDITRIEWLMDQSEKFCQEKAIHNAIRESIVILEDKSGDKSKGLIPQLLSNALGVSFDTHIGHDFLDDSEDLYKFLHTVEEKIPFDLDFLNRITKGGLSRKTLNIALAGTGVGKSLFMCHCAAANLIEGKNVLYITLEMSEERIAERITANLLDEPIEQLSTLPKIMYDKKVERIKRKTTGKLIIKEYPTACAGSANFRHLINELKIKKNFVPDIIYIDYLNICSSSRLKHGANINSYTYIKAIAEELRGLAVEFNVPIVSATQVTRGGYSSSDIGLEDTSESFGLPATADLMFALISTDELENLGQIMIKQLKNRYSDVNLYKRFVIGIDRSKMRLYNVEQSAQEDILDGPVMDNTTFGEEDNERNKKKTKFQKFR